MTLHETIASPPIAAKVATGVTYAASGAAIIFGLNANELGVFIGLFIAFGAGVTNAYIGYHFRQKHFKLVEEYVKSGQERRVTQDRREIDGSPCDQCPMQKHRTDFNG